MQEEDYPTSLYAANVWWSCLSFPPLFHSRVDFLQVFISALFLYLLQVHPYLKKDLHKLFP